MPPARTRQTKPTLADLSDADRAELLAELEASKAETSETDAEREAAVRSQLIAAGLDDRDHLRGCPGGRVEMYEATRPAQPSKGRPAADVTVVRCIECGGSTVIETSYAAALAALDQEVAAAIADDDDEEG
jgi:hypothetical protein